MQQLTTIKANLSDKVRRVQRGGRDFLVAPMVILQEGVMNGLLYPANEIADSFQAWNGVPLTLSHPKQRGVDVSANSPDILDAYELGRFFNAELVGGSKVRGEAWLDIERIRALGADAEELAAAIERGRGVDVSTGLYLDETGTPGRYNGQRYQAVGRHFLPDHVAILPNEIGACSWADGCGIPRANTGGAMEFNVLSQARTPEFDGTESTDWSQVDKTFEAYRDAYLNSSGAEKSDKPWANVGQLPAAAKTWIASRSLLGDPEAESFDELLFYPVVDPSNDRLNENALTAVLGGRGSQADIPQAAIESAQAKARALLSDQFDREPAANESAKARLIRTLAKALGVEITITEESSMDRTKVIKALSDCGDCPITAAELEKLEDESLQALSDRLLAADDKDKAGDEPKPDERKKDDEEPKANETLAALSELVDELGGVDKVGELLRGIKGNSDQERAELVKALKANESVEFADEEIDAMSIGLLRKVAAMAEPEVDFSGRGFIRNVGEGDEDDLPYVPAPKVVLAKNGHGKGKDEK